MMMVDAAVEVCAVELTTSFAYFRWVRRNRRWRQVLGIPMLNVKAKIQHRYITGRLVLL